MRDACEVLIADGEQLFVCESCADLAVRNLRAEGRIVESARVWSSACILEHPIQSRKGSNKQTRSRVELLKLLTG